jgi:ubiquinone biosynthesis protein COQ9
MILVSKQLGNRTMKELVIHNLIRLALLAVFIPSMFWVIDEVNTYKATKKATQNELHYVKYLDSNTGTFKDCIRLQ